MMLLITWLLTSLTSLLVAGDGLGRISIDPDRHWFTDEEGRVVILRGVNSVMKAFPWYQPPMLEDYRYEDLERFGFNIVRLGAMWAGAEPERGMYNRTYFQMEEEIVNRLADIGAYSMLDMHQDCISSKFLYDGIPRWVVDLYPEPENEYPWPLDEITAWEQCYITQAVCEVFQHLYNDTESTMQLWGDFWAELAQEFHENPAVIGYNYINEPGVGDSFSDADLLLPGVAGRRNLLPTYDYLTERVRQVDSQGLVFYEPVFYGQLFSNETVGSGFDRFHVGTKDLILEITSTPLGSVAKRKAPKVPGGPGNEHLSAYSWHAYCWFLEFLDSDSTEEEQQQAKDRCDNWLLPKMFRSAQETVSRIGGVSILTEFGICNGWDDKDWPEPWTECETFIDLADEHFESWTEWGYTGGWYRGETPRWGRILPHIRPFPRATAGEPIHNYFNKTSLEYSYTFTLDTNIDAPTELFVPSLRYIDGFTVAVSDNLEYEVDGDVLLLEPQEGVDGPQEASVTINPIGEGVNKHNFRQYYST